MLRFLLQKGPMQGVKNQTTRVAIIGGGFGGRYAAERLAKRLPRGSSVTLIDRNDYMLYTPMLTEVAGRSVSPRHIQVPNRTLARGVEFLQEEVVSADLARRSVTLRSGKTIEADHLLFALGSVTNFHGVEGAEEHSFTLKTLDDARRVRTLAQHMVRQAFYEHNSSSQQSLSFIVAGGGYTGVESIAALNDLVKDTAQELGLSQDNIQLTLIESADRLMAEMPESLAAYTRARLEEDGVRVLTGVGVKKLTAHDVLLSNGESLPNGMLIWNTGIKPNPLVALLECDKGKNGGIATDSAFQVNSHRGVWAIGDCALIPKPDHSDAFFEPTAQNATRQGTHVADNILRVLAGKPVQPFRFKQVGALAVIARHNGVAHVFGVRVKGVLGWLLWRAIYLIKMPSMSQRCGLLSDWLRLAFARRHVPVSWRLQQRASVKP